MTPFQRRRPVMARASGADIERWLVSWIARTTEIAPDAVEIDRPLADFGLNSLQIANLSADLERALGHAIEETAVWDHPTIALLSAHLGGQPAAPTPRQAAL